MDDPGINPGEVDAEKPANPEIQVMCDSVKPEFQEKSGINAAKYEAVSNKTQADAAGTNQFVKVDTGKGQSVLLELDVFLDLVGKTLVSRKFQLGKKKEDPITDF